jgi:hypothetical protein
MEVKMENQTLEQAREGKINPLEAVRLLNTEIGGITAVTWNPGAGNYKIINHNVKIPLPMRNSNRKEQERLEEVAVLAFWMAQQNGSLKPGEVHIDKGCSSKHYKKRFLEYTTSLLAEYN